MEKQRKASKIKHLVLAAGLATGLAFLTGCDFSYGYVRNPYYSPPSRTYFHVPRPYYREYPSPYYQPNYFFVPRSYPYHYPHQYRDRRR